MTTSFQLTNIMPAYGMSSYEYSVKVTNDKETSNAKEKISIDNIKAMQKIPEFDLAMQKEIVTHLFFKELHTLSYETLYRQIYTLCLGRSTSYNRELYNNFKYLVILTIPRCSCRKEHNETTTTCEWLKRLCVLDSILIYLYRMLNIRKDDYLQNILHAR